MVLFPLAETSTGFIPLLFRQGLCKLKGEGRNEQAREAALYLLAPILANVSLKIQFLSLNQLLSPSRAILSSLLSMSVEGTSASAAGPHKSYSPQRAAVVGTGMQTESARRGGS